MDARGLTLQHDFSGLLGAAETRPIYWGFTTAREVLFYVLVAVTLIIFAYGIVQLPLKYRRGRGGPWPPRPWRELPSRLWAGVVLLLTHATIRRRDRAAGWGHLGMFLGFVVLLIGTLILTVQVDFTSPVLGWEFFQGSFYVGFKWFMNVAGLALAVGLVVMMVRRGIARPAKLDYEAPDRAHSEVRTNRPSYRIGDWTLLVVLLAITVTGFLLQGVRVAMDDPGDAASQFGGWLPGLLLDPLDVGVLANLRHGFWWLHALLSLAFVAALPYTKAAHMVTSFVSLSLRDLQAVRRLSPIPPERATEPAGYGALVDFSPLHLLQLDACTKCGKCHEACPAHEVGFPLSPRDLTLECHEQSVDATGMRGLRGFFRLSGKHDSDDGFVRSIVGIDKVSQESVWSCMQCSACVDICPVGVEQAPIINQIRRRLLEEGDVDSNLQKSLETIHKSGNSFGENKRKRGRWAAGLDFEVPDARKERVDLLWFVGDYMSFDPRCQDISRALARLLHKAGVDFGILYDGEWNSGNDVRRSGEEGLFEVLAAHNIESIAACDFNRILTADPHSLNTLRNEYPDFGGSWPVIQHSTLLLELIESGRLEIQGRLGARATFHDPCHLGRMNGEYEAPRRILQHLGCALVEMSRTHDNSFCCGAGGGRIWVTDTPGQERPSENRIREAAQLSGVELFVVACPKDVAMFEDAVKTTGHEGRIKVRELTELIEEALSGATNQESTGSVGRSDSASSVQTVER